VGVQSLGTAPKRLVRQWLADRDEDRCPSSVATDPSFADILKHGSPEAGWGATVRRSTATLLRPSVRCGAVAARWVDRKYERFKAVDGRSAGRAVHDALDAALSRVMSSVRSGRGFRGETRMSLNTFARHGVFECRECGRSSRHACVTPQGRYVRACSTTKLLTAYANCDPQVPRIVRDGWQDAMELAGWRSVPVIEGKSSFARTFRDR